MLDLGHLMFYRFLELKFKVVLLPLYSNGSNITFSQQIFCSRFHNRLNQILRPFFEYFRFCSVNFQNKSTRLRGGGGEAIVEITLYETVYQYFLFFKTSVAIQSIKSIQLACTLLNSLEIRLSKFSLLSISDPNNRTLLSELIFSHQYLFLQDYCFALFIDYDCLEFFRVYKHIPICGLICFTL